MAAVTNMLSDLHKLHLQLREVFERLERGPRHLKVRQQMVAQKQTEVEAQREKLKKLKVAADQSGLQLKTNESKIADLKGKLNAASSNREFDIIKSQIEADTVANSVLEDEILDLLEKVDLAKVAVGKLEQELAAAEAEKTRLTTEFASIEGDLRTQVSQFEAAIAGAEVALPEDIKVVYRRLVQAHGSGAFAEVDGSVCTSCYVQMTPQMLMELRSGKLMQCRTCGRLLYVQKD